MLKVNSILAVALFTLSNLFFPTQVAALEEPCNSYLAVSMQSPHSGEYPYSKIRTGMFKNFYCAGMVEQSHSDQNGLLVSYFWASSKLVDTMPLPTAIGIRDSIQSKEVHVTLMSDATGFRMDSVLEHDAKVYLQTENIPEDLDFELASTQIVGRINLIDSTIFVAPELVHNPDETNVLHLAIASTSTSARVIVFSGEWDPANDIRECKKINENAHIDKSFETLEFEPVSIDKVRSSSFCLRIFHQSAPTSNLVPKDYFFF